MAALLFLFCQIHLRRVWVLMSYEVILFGTIPTSIPIIPVVPAKVPIIPADPLVAPEMGVVFVISPTRVLDLVDYSSFFDSDPLEDSLPSAPELPLVSPFLCSYDSEAVSESEPTKQRPERHESFAVYDSMVSRLALEKCISSFSGMYVILSPYFYFRIDSSSSSSSDSSSDISSGSSSDSLSDSSSVHSSGQSHSGRSTRVASPRLVDPPVRTPRRSEAFMRWRYAPLSTLYPPTTSESSPDSFLRGHWIHLHLLLDHLAIDVYPLLLLAILVRPGEAIPFGRPYRTHPNEPQKLLTARKRFGPFPARRLAWRRVSHRPSDRHSSPDSTLDSSSSGSSAGSSSDISLGSPLDSLSDTSSVHFSGCNTSGQTHSGPSTRVSLPRLVYPPVMTPRYSEAFRRWRPPTTLLPSSTPVLRLIAFTFVDLLPPCKRLGVEVTASDIKEDEEEFEAEASAGGTIEIAVDPLVTRGISESTGGDAPDLKGTLYDIAQYMLDVPLDKITKIRRLGRENLRVRALLCIERDRVDNLRHHMALSQEKFHQIRRDQDDARRRLRRLELLVERRLGFRP
ncbi:hypothetical protein Tco_0005060 [Tanacetum coccineum]